MSTVRRLKVMNNNVNKNTENKSEFSVFRLISDFMLTHYTKSLHSLCLNNRIVIPFCHANFLLRLLINGLIYKINEKNKIK